MQIKSINDIFSKKEVIMEGTYGIVYKATSAKNEQILAVKKYKPISTTTKNGLCMTLLREINLIKSLKHQNIIEFLEILVDEESQIYAVMPFYQKSLKKYVFTNLNTKMQEIRFIFRQILQATEYLHKNSVVHRDINPRNILIDELLTVKVCDFGLARLVFAGNKVALTQEVVTLNYRAPEILLGESFYGKEIDMWSLGCVFVELVTGRSLFKSSSDKQLLAEICHVLGTPNELTWPDFKFYVNKQKLSVPKCEESPEFRIELVNGGLSRSGIDLTRKLLVFDPLRRIDATAALAHPFFLEN